MCVCVCVCARALAYVCVCVRAWLGSAVRGFRRARLHQLLRGLLRANFRKQEFFLAPFLGDGATIEVRLAKLLLVWAWLVEAQ